jgi:hypothetical protein
MSPQGERGIDVAGMGTGLLVTVMEQMSGRRSPHASNRATGFDASMSFTT